MLNVQYDPGNYTSPLHGRQWIKVLSQTDSIRYNTKFKMKLLDRLDTKECKDFRLFVHSVQQTTPRILKNQSVKLETEVAYRSMTHPSGTCISHSLQELFSKLLEFFRENLQHTH